jgi:hypothetical protein
MLSSGKSKAKREAKKQMQKAYLDALKGTERAERAGNVDTGVVRQLNDSGLEIDGYTQALGYKADKVAKQYNEATPELNKSIDAYNQRYDLMKRQMNGEKIQDGFQVESPVSGTGIAQVLPRDVKTFGLNETSQAEDYANSLNDVKPAQDFGMGRTAPQTQGLGLLNAAPVAQARVADSYQGPINGSYRTLSQTQDAYNDLSKLSKNISKVSETAGLGDIKSEYETIAQRIRNGVKRAQPIQKPVGLLNSELASSRPRNVNELMEF